MYLNAGLLIWESERMRKSRSKGEWKWGDVFYSSFTYLRTSALPTGLKN